jgi:Reverse transcriptase (RNA-dependent DNA polymerase).
VGTKKFPWKFKLSTPFISSSLNYIFHKSLSLGIFPSRLKFSIIKPFFRKGDRNNMVNDRPISLLTSFLKVLDKITHKRHLHHISANSVLVNQSFGFWTKSSTEEASFQLLIEILIALNNRLMVGGIFCNFEKAFDCFSQDILLYNLKFYGVTGKTVLLIKSYL